MIKIAYFSCGAVGEGHRVRGWAIWRALNRLGLLDSVVWEVFDPTVDDADRGRGYTLAQWCAFRLQCFKPTLVLVDINLEYFAASMLKNWNGPRPIIWWLTRWMPLQFYNNQPGLLAQRRFVIEPCAQENMHWPAEKLNPIVSHNLNEMANRADSLERFGLPPDATSIGLAVHAGQPGEFDMLRDHHALKTCEYVVELDWHGEPSKRVMVSPFVGIFSKIVTGAGYNRFFETHWLRLERCTVFVPFDRLNGEQEARLAWHQENPSWRMTANGADELAGHIKNHFNLTSMTPIDLSCECQ